MKSLNSKKILINLENREAFQDRIDGKATDLFLLKNQNGMQAAITNYGGRLVSLLVPDKDKELTDVVVGFESVQEYVIATEPYYGAIVGRYANRIAGGKFRLDDKEYLLFINNGINTLHGGKTGYQYVVWNAKQPDCSTLELTYLSMDGEEGFPGSLTIKIIYTVSANNELRIDYEAITDKKTIINLTNHSFFNLNGQGSGTINDHLVMINADKYTPVDFMQIPTGKIEPVSGSPFDFRTPASIGSRLNNNEIQLKNGKGYDHNFVLNTCEGDELRHAAEVSGDQSGIVMDVYTSEPGIQFYGGNCMPGKNIIKGGKTDDYRTAFCLETQHFPNSPNEPSFPSTVLMPGENFKSITIYRFSLKN